MSDNPVTNVNRVDLQPAQIVQTQVRQAAATTAPKETVPASKELTSAPKAVEVSKKDAAAAKAEAADQAAQKPAQVPLISRDTNLKFQVDDKTHQVTIMIMDRATNKVITTIPPDKIKDVPPGDLLQYMI
jgi:uncharacterized FlaG/YvyC family protein